MPAQPDYLHQIAAGLPRMFVQHQDTIDRNNETMHAFHAVRGAAIFLPSSYTSAKKESTDGQASPGTA